MRGTVFSQVDLQEYYCIKLQKGLTEKAQRLLYGKDKANKSMGQLMVSEH